MKSLKDLRKRRMSVLSIQKVIEAMRMIAKSKYAFTSKQALAFRPYHEKFQEIVNSLLEATIEEQVTTPNNKHLLIVMTSDRGMCGAFNTSLINYIKNFVSKNIDEDFLLLCVGSKGFMQLKDAFSVLHRTFAFEKVKFIDAQNICDNIYNLMDKHNIEKCSVIYTKLISVFKQKISIKQLIPFQQDAPKERTIGNSPVLNNQNNITSQSESHHKNNDGYDSVNHNGRYDQDGDLDENNAYESNQSISPIILFEPNHAFLLKKLQHRNLAASIYYALLENAASEQAARMNSMDGASTNAKDMFKELNLEYNATRQALITKEISEIVAATN